MNLSQLFAYPLICGRCFSPAGVAGESVSSFVCTENRSSSSVVVAVLVSLIIVGVIFIVCCFVCRARLRRSSSRQSHRYSAVYRETVEQSSQPM